MIIAFPNNKMQQHPIQQFRMEKKKEKRGKIARNLVKCLIVGRPK